MSIPQATSQEIITAKKQLIDYMAAGCKPKTQWRIGTEHEKFAYRRADLAPLAYEGAVSISALLKGFERFGWQPLREGHNIIGLHRGGASISLEPGGQFELSGAPLATLHEVAAELAQHQNEIHAIASPLDIGFAALGFHPLASREAMPWMPKGRYSIMRQYMPQQGALGLDMMLRTCTVQVNLDFASEADMVQKMRVALALQPVAMALFATSPFYEGQPAGYISYRNQIWTDVDPQRSGQISFAFAPDFGFERYVDYALDVPMYFVYRQGKYISASGQSFRDFMAGRLPALPGEYPILSDWADHLTTLFPDVRLKQFLEMRGADSGPPAMLNALPAFWTGLLYEQGALNDATELVKDWDPESLQQLRHDATQLGLMASIKGQSLQDIALKTVKISQLGLRRRAHRLNGGADESRYLEPLFIIAESGLNLAAEWLVKYQTDWQHDVRPVFAAANF